MAQYYRIHGTLLYVYTTHTITEWQSKKSFDRKKQKRTVL